MSSNILELKNIRKIYHDKSGETLELDNINLEEEIKNANLI